MRFMTSPMIRAFGYKTTWWVCGGFGIVTGILMMTTVVEPVRQGKEVKVEEKDPEKRKTIMKRTTGKF